MADTNSRSKTVINHIKPNLVRYGIPEITVSDNGPEFSSREFEEFAEYYGFKHTTTSPRYPQSNGLVERAVQTAKNLLTKAMIETSDFHLALLAYRNTPIKEIELSPAQMLMGRHARTRLPITPSLLEPQYPTDKINQGLRRRAEVQQQYCNQHARLLKPLNTGDTVRIKKPGQKTWTPAEVIKLTESPRSYVVESEGTRNRRNRRDLMKTVEASGTDHRATADQQHILGASQKKTSSPAKEPVNSEKVSLKGRILRPSSWLKDYSTS